MKLIITEEQLKLIIESEQEGRLMNVPTEILKNEESYDKIYNLYKDNKDRKNYIGIKVIGDLDLSGGRYGMKINSSVIKFCEELIEVDGYLRVGGNLYINNSKIKSLPNLESVGGYLYIRDSQFDSLPMLSKVGKGLFLMNTPIKELPMLIYVGEDLNLTDTPLSKTTTEEELRNKIEVRGEIAL